MAKVYGNGITSLSVGGKQYDSADGVFDVPDQHVAALLEHGLSRTPPAGREVPVVVGTARVEATVLEAPQTKGRRR